MPGLRPRWVCRHQQANPLTAWSKIIWAGWQTAPSHDLSPRGGFGSTRRFENIFWLELSRCRPSQALLPLAGFYQCNGECISVGTCCTNPDSCAGDFNTCPKDGGVCPGCDTGYVPCGTGCILNGTCCTNPDTCPGDHNTCPKDGGQCPGCDTGESASSGCAQALQHPCLRPSLTTTCSALLSTRTCLVAKAVGEGPHWFVGLHRPRTINLCEPSDALC